jgi:hypothetical protein
MARMRSLKPEYWGDMKMARVSRDARLLYLALWNQSDEWARCHGDTRWIKGHCLPYDDDLNLKAIDRLLDELERIDRILRYEVDGERFIYLPKLAKHQRLEPAKTPSRLPPPPDSEKIPDLSENFPDESVEIVVQHVAGSREHGAGSKEHVAGGESADKSAAPKRATRIPDDFLVTPDMLTWARENTPGLNIGLSTEKFIDYWRSKGTNATKTDWVATWRNWLRSDHERNPGVQNGRASPRLSTGEQRALAAVDAAEQVIAARIAQNRPPQIGAS